MQNKLIENFREGRLSIGALLMDRSVVAMPALAKGGYDYVKIDLMYGTVNWSDVHHMCLAAHEVGLTAIVRVQAYPWREKGEVDRRLVVDASRAASLGADGITVSANSAAEVRDVAGVTQDWHRVGHVQSSAEELAAHEEEITKNFTIMPIVESIGALDELEEIMDVEGVNSIMMSCTDLPRQLGYPYQYEHPKVWEYIERAVKLGEQKGVAVGANTGFVFTTIDDTIERIKRLRDHGVHLTLTQTGYHMMYSYCSSITDALGKDGVLSPRAGS